MEKLICNKVICVGNFNGPDIEEGTFHDRDTVMDINHNSMATQKCPCTTIEFHGVKVQIDSKEGSNKDTNNND